MNLKITILLFISLLSISSFAQNKVKVGIKGGVNFSGFHAGGSSAYTQSFGVHFGVISQYKINDKFFIQPELIYTQKTGGASELNGGTSFFLRSDRDYLDLPLMVKYSFGSNFGLEIGPQIGFLIKEDSSISYNGSSTFEDISSEAKSVDFSANIGISYQFNSKIIAQLRYSYGLSKVFDSLDDKNSVFLIGVGYFLN